jgi:hypothetical protein
MTPKIVVIIGISIYNQTKVNIYFLYFFLMAEAKENKTTEAVASSNSSKPGLLLLGVIVGIVVLCCCCCFGFFIAGSLSTDVKYEYCKTLTDDFTNFDGSDPLGWCEDEEVLDKILEEQFKDYGLGDLDLNLDLDDLNY